MRKKLEYAAIIALFAGTVVLSAFQLGYITIGTAIRTIPQSVQAAASAICKDYADDNDFTPVSYELRGGVRIGTNNTTSLLCIYSEGTLPFAVFTNDAGKIVGVQ